MADEKQPVQHELPLFEIDKVPFLNYFLPWFTEAELVRKLNSFISI